MNRARPRPFAPARPALAALAVALAFLAAPPLRADLRWTAATRAGWAENISRTSAGANAKDSATLETSLVAAYPRAFARDWLLTGGVGAESFIVRDFSLNNTLALGPHVALRRKFGLGAMAPELTGSLGVQRLDARLRGATGWTSTAGLAYSQRFSTAFRATAGVERHRQDGSVATFDVRNRSVFARLAWTITPRFLLTAGYARLSGQLVAHASGPVFARARAGAFGPLVAETYKARPWLVTDSYGPGWVSYRNDAVAGTTTLALTAALFANTSADLRFSSSRVENTARVVYKSDTLSFGLIHRF